MLKSEMKVWLVTVLTVVGCGKGAPTGPITVTPTQYDVRAMTQVDLKDGAIVDLVRPPQGGFVLFIGARATNLGETAVKLRGRLKDAAGTILGEDVRTVEMQPATDNAAQWTTDLRAYTTVSNIAVCPSTSTTDRVNATFSLEEVVTEPSSRRTGLGAVTVTLACRQTDAMQLKLCQCECAGDYFPGKCTL